MKKIIRVCLGISVLLGFVMTIHAGTYYISPDGDDQADGSFEAPWQTIQHGINNAQAGDRIMVRAGVYAEKVQVLSAASGIVLEGELDAQGKRAVTLAAYDTASGSVALKINGAADVVVKNLKVIRADTGIWVDRGTNIAIENVEVYTNQTTGLWVQGSKDIVLRSSVICGNLKQGVCFKGTTNIQVEGNAIFDNDARYESIYYSWCEGVGLTLTNCRNVHVAGNRVESNGGRGGGFSVGGWGYESGQSGINIAVYASSDVLLDQNEVIGLTLYGILLDTVQRAQLLQNRISLGWYNLEIKKSEVSVIRRNNLGGYGSGRGGSAPRDFGGYNIEIDALSSVGSIEHNNLYYSPASRNDVDGTPPARYILYNEGQLSCDLKHNYYGLTNPESILGVLYGVNPDCIQPIRTMPLNIDAQQILFPAEAPANLAGWPSETEVVGLSWSAPQQLVNGDPIDPGLPVSYRVYRRTTIAFPIQCPSAADLYATSLEPHFSDASAQPGVKYYYAVTAVMDGHESLPSATVEVVGPEIVNPRYDDRVWLVDAAVAASGDGSAEAPFKTIAEALAQVRPSQTILVRPGRYQEALNLNTPLIKLSGVVNPVDGSLPVVDVGAGLVTIDHRQGITIQNLQFEGTSKILNLNYADNVKLIGLKVIKPCYDDGAIVWSLYPVVENCVFHSANGRGLRLGACQAPIIRNNRFETGIASLTVSGGSYCQIQNNHMTSLSVDSLLSIVLNNTIISSSCVLRGDRMLAAGNLVLGNEMQLWTLKNSLIWGNYVAGLGWGSGITAINNSTNTVLLNNTVRGTQVQGLMIQSGTHAKQIVGNNFIENAALNINGTGKDPYVRGNYYGAANPAQFKLSGIDDPDAARSFSPAAIDFQGIPEAPQALAAEATPGGIRLAWSPATRCLAVVPFEHNGATYPATRVQAIAGPVSYKVYRMKDANKFPPHDRADNPFPQNAELIATLTDALSFTDAPLAPGDYYYAITAVNGAGAEAKESWATEAVGPVTVADADGDGFLDVGSELMTLDLNGWRTSVNGDGTVSAANPEGRSWITTHRAPLASGGVTIEKNAGFAGAGDDVLQVRVTSEGLAQRNPAETLYVSLMRKYTGKPLPAPGHYYKISFDARRLEATAPGTCTVYWVCQHLKYRKDGVPLSKHLVEPSERLTEIGQNWQTFDRIVYLPNPGAFDAWDGDAFKMRLDMASAGRWQFDNFRIAEVTPVSGAWLDQDRDGMPDGWEGKCAKLSAYSFYDAFLATTDYDGDGFYNLEEYLGGGDPESAASTPNVTDATPLVERNFTGCARTAEGNIALNNGFGYTIVYVPLGSPHVLVDAAAGYGGGACLRIAAPDGGGNPSVTMYPRLARPTKGEALPQPGAYYRVRMKVRSDPAGEVHVCWQVNNYVDQETGATAPNAAPWDTLTTTAEWTEERGYFWFDSQKRLLETDSFSMRLQFVRPGTYYIDDLVLEKVNPPANP